MLKLHRSETASSTGSVNSITSTTALLYYGNASATSVTGTASRKRSRTPLHNRRWVRTIWMAHFTGGLLMIMIGVANNYWPRKYIPVNPSAAMGVSNGFTDDLSTCDKVFLNVMAASGDEEGAIVCCDQDPTGGITDICPSPASTPPLALRLARFPDAWLLPLFPLLLRLLFMIYKAYVSSDGRLLSGIIDSSSVIVPALRRLGFYIALLNFRGWVLYVALNGIEDLIVRPSSAPCWYHEWLRDDQPDCTGRVFDFSDHIVLYFAQILPIALLEFVYSWKDQYWKEHQHNLQTTSPARMSSINSLQNTDHIGKTLSKLVPVCLLCGMAYLYFITYLGVFKTAYYFHTGSEVIAGFLVSLLVHVPLCCIQCSDHCESMRNYLFAEGKVA